MRFFNSAREYHKKTKYSYDDIKFVYREFSSEPQPPTHKSYSGKTVIDLPKDYDTSLAPLSEALEKSANFNEFHKLKDEEIILSKLSQLLFLTNGVTLIRDFPGKKIMLRAAPSGSALYPVEIYLIANRVRGLKKGIYYFNPVEHQLIEVSDADKSGELNRACFGLNFLKNAPVQLVFTSVFSRSSWKFKKRAYRYCLMDAGYVAENLLLAAAGAGLTCNLIGDFVDDSLNQVIEVDGVSEVSFLVAALGKDDGLITRESYKFYMHSAEKDVINEHHTSLNRGIHVLSSHYAEENGKVDVDVALPFKKEFEAETPTGEVIQLPEAELNLKYSIHEVIEERRSTHNFLRISVTLKELSALLASTKKVPTLYNYPAFKTYFVANDVDQLENGVYHYHPQNHSIELLRKGTYRGDISYLTLAQDAVFNCSVAFFFSTDFEQVNLFSNRGYRYAHINTGMLSEAISLTSTALGIGSRGIGNFFDDSINTFFRVNEPNENILGGLIAGRF